MIRIATWNICGWKSAIRKGLPDFLLSNHIDIACFQEIKTHAPILPLSLQDYSAYFTGKSSPWGVAILSKPTPRRIITRIGHHRFDEEGRFLRLDFDKFNLINIYIPHGGRKKENLDYKLEVLGYLKQYLEREKLERLIIVGDFNIAREEMDLAFPRKNQGNVMFTPEEREALEELLGLGLMDVFRELNPGKREYTWFLRAFNCKERDIGWRIDYILVSKDLLPFVRSVKIIKNAQISDHVPVIMDLT